MGTFRDGTSYDEQSHSPPEIRRSRSRVGVGVLWTQSRIVGSDFDHKTWDTEPVWETSQFVDWLLPPEYDEIREVGGIWYKARRGDSWELWVVVVNRRARQLLPGAHDAIEIVQQGSGSLILATRAGSQSAFHHDGETGSLVEIKGMSRRTFAQDAARITGIQESSILASVDRLSSASKSIVTETAEALALWERGRECYMCGDWARSIELLATARRELLACNRQYAAALIALDLCLNHVQLEDEESVRSLLTSALPVLFEENQEDRATEILMALYDASQTAFVTDHMILDAARIVRRRI